MKTNLDKLIYEVSFYFLMDVPKDFEPVCSSVTEEGLSESMKWVSPDMSQRMFPDFSVMHFCMDNSGHFSGSVRNPTEHDLLTMFADVKSNIIIYGSVNYNMKLLICPKKQS